MITEKQRLINLAYKQKLQKLNLPFFTIRFLNFKNSFIPFGLEYKKLEFTKYFCMQIIIINITFNLNLKTIK